jgi:hypothetical protein
LITLRSASGTTLTTRTDETGHYLFMNVMPDVYDLHESQPDGYVHRGSIVGTGASKTGIVDPTLPNSVSAVGLNFGDTAVEYSFIERSTAPVPTPTTTTTPAAETPVSTTPATTSPAIDPTIARPPRVPTRGLPTTGSDIRNAVTMASLLLTFGVTLFAIGRRRRAR